MVSIHMLAYNHEPYIAQAIEGVLMQQTNFPIELVIGEDCSKDLTREIIINYQKKYPNIIRVIISEENVGVIKNSIRTSIACRGKYISFCEGDDYWICSNKLQKQIDFLEMNPEFMGTAHQSLVKYDDTQREEHLFRQGVKSIIMLTDLLKSRIFHTASFVFRNNFFSFNNIPLDITSLDRALFLLCSTYGPIKYFEEPMCVYRKSLVGISSWVTYDLMKKDLNIVPWIKSIYPSFPKFRYLSFVHKTIAIYPQNISVRKIIKHLFLYFLFSFSYFPNNLYELFKFSALKKAFRLFH